ncbi:MAG: glycosyltransferase [Verrucomicrobiota bacterium]
MATLCWAVAISRRDNRFETELGTAVCRCLQELGHSAKLVYDGEPAELRADVLLLLVNLGNFSGYCDQLRRGHSRRPVVVVWQMDPLPPTALDPEAERIGLAAARWRRVFRLNRSAAAMTRWKKLATLIRLREWACKLCSAPGYRRAWQLMSKTPGLYDDFDWRQVRGVMQAWATIREAHADQWVDCFVMSTQQRQRFLASRGIAADFVPVGAYAETGRELGTPRDLAVAFLGSAKHGRRAARLAELGRSLQERGIVFQRIESNCYGEERTALLNRTHILVNLHNYPWSPAWIRFLMAASCGTLVVSEPTEDNQPFVAGQHYVAVTFEEMPDTIFRLFNDPGHCARITRAASALCRNELTLLNAVQSLCRQASAAKLRREKT